MHLRVSLLAACLCAAAASSANSLTTLFSAGNNGASLWTVYMDISVTAANGITITAFDVNTATANTSFSLDVYTTAAGGTYVGNTSNVGAWTLQGSGAGVSAAALGQPSNANTADFSLAAGTYGLAIRYTGISPYYTNGNGSNQFYSNSDLSLTLGAAQATTTAPFTGGTPFSPRVWNGTVYYDVNPVPEPATMTALGLGVVALIRRRRR